MKFVAVLLTVHDRKEKTLECLKQVCVQQLPDGYAVDIFLTDDGCTDGTSEAVAREYPQVNIIHGDGTLFWNRGMAKAWTAAVSRKDYDFYLWLNDDTRIYSDAFANLITTSSLYNDKNIVVGSACATDNCNGITYGGYSKNKLVVPQDKPQRCDYFNGNIVLFPKYVYDIVGMNDSSFSHALGDFDYGLRAGQLNVKSVVAPGIMGVCDRHESLPVWRDSERSVFERWKAFRTPLGQNPEEFFVFENRHHGMFSAVFHYVTNHVRVFFPWLWKNNDF